MRNILLTFSFIFMILFISCSEFEHSNPFDPEYKSDGGILTYQIDYYTVSQYFDHGTAVEYNLNIFVKYFGREQVQLYGKISTSDSNIFLTDFNDKYYVLNSGETNKSNFPYRFKLSKTIPKPYVTFLGFTLKNNSTNEELSDSLSITIN
ncbi:MAG: hypothetical protein K9H48_11125 [Melioribacteraceae bacterium]|nr:hypothetical protein [Melioribacteraceae bacterium]MCF8394320.1 hypothetical protein [Melioribacteraceae bacterium]MCF8419999.1 hypothetical protein [Melioribacteraceae bacterium]